MTDSVATETEPRRPRESFKVRLDRLLNPGDDDSHVLDSFIITLIAFNVLAVIVETEPELAAKYSAEFFWFEFFSAIFFTVEYFARLWVADLDPRYQGSFKGRLRYMFTAMAMVDVIAVLPFYLSFIEMDLRIARAIRLLRLVRILKMGRYAHAVRTLTNVIVRKKEELAMSMFVAVMILILSASVMYFAENERQPDAFRSIPASMWWAVVTLTSVGYGDVSPETDLGKLMGAFICMIGVMLVALPTGILASGFADEIREQKEGKKEVGSNFQYCPHCGKHLTTGDEQEE